MLDAPQLNAKGLHIAGISSSETEGAVKEVNSSTCMAGPGASGSWDSWGVGGRWWQMESGRLSYGDVGLRTQRNVILLPSGAHKNPSPLRLPLLPPTSLTLWSLGVALPPLAAMPLCTVS